MQLTETQREWCKWVERDPSVHRVCVAGKTYNWDEGLEFIHWLLETQDCDQSVIYEICILLESFEDDAYQDPDEKALADRVQGRWESGAYRSQQYSPHEPGQIRGKRRDEMSFRPAAARYPVLEVLLSIDFAKPIPRCDDLDGDDLEAFRRLNNWS
ncbi:MAG: hypothetical protein AB8B85_15900 [Paracoccaceae bacterium]